MAVALPKITDFVPAERRVSAREPDTDMLAGLRVREQVLLDDMREQIAGLAKYEQALAKVEDDRLRWMSAQTSVAWLAGLHLQYKQVYDDLGVSLAETRRSAKKASKQAAQRGATGISEDAKALQAMCDRIRDLSIRHLGQLVKARSRVEAIRDRSRSKYVAGSKAPAPVSIRPVLGADFDAELRVVMDETAASRRYLAR